MKGRYREFYQCDADVVGSNSLLNEVELVQMIDAVFSKFGIRVSIKINNRKILTGIAEIIGEADKIVDITVAIDKLDKIGLENVNAELASKGIPQEAIDKLQPIILLSGSNEEKLETLKSVLAASETGLKGVEESEFILKTISTLGIKSEVELDLTLARGLNYYTGAIFEVKALDVYENRMTRIPTARLNEEMLPLIEAYPPPSIKGKYIKIKYITQLPNTQVPSFVYFANLPQYVKEPYRRFLENKMREKWKLTGTPINIYIRQK